MIRNNKLFDSKERPARSSVYSFERFSTFDGNLVAYNAANAVANAPSKSYNPLYLYGGHGSGKTHLLKAIEGAISEKHPEMCVRYVTSEEFCNDVLGAIRCGFTADIREIYRTPDVLIIDDIQFLIGKEITLDEMFHTLDTLIRNGSQVVISADQPPKKLDVGEHMRAVLGRGLVVELKAPSTSVKNNLVRVKAEEKGVLLQDDVVDYISSNIGDNIGMIEGAITSIVAYSELSRPVINLDAAKTVLADVL